VQRLLHGGAGHRAASDGPLREAHRSPLWTVRLRRQCQCRAGAGADGSVSRVARAVDKLVAAGEKSASSRCGCTGRSMRRRSSMRCRRPCTRSPCSTAQGAGRDREPLYQDVVTALSEVWPQGKPMPHVIGGRYGLSSKEYTPAMAKAALDETAGAAAEAPISPSHRRRRHHLSLKWDPAFDTEAEGVTRAIFYGLGADGRWCDQEHGQDHRREHAASRPGLLRLRQQEVRRDHRVAPALRAEADRVDLSDRPGRLHRLPPVRIMDKIDVLDLAPPAPPSCSTAPTGPITCGTSCRARRRRPSRQEAQVLRRRRARRRPAGRPRRAHQHGDAGVLLRDLGHPAARRGDRKIKDAIARPTASAANRC